MQGQGNSFSGTFDIKIIVENLERCIGTNNESEKYVNVDAYAQVFKQLYKFFNMLGKIFGFVGSDLKEKVGILENFREGHDKEKYETVEKMLDFEVSTGQTTCKKESSGSRTLLRLHRSLIFVSDFLRRTLELMDDDGAGDVCRLAYDTTLAKFHPWVIRKGAHLAMMTLPTKGDIIAKVCGDRYSKTEVDLLVPRVIALTLQIYERCEKLYEHHDLHSLP